MPRLLADCAAYARLQRSGAGNSEFGNSAAFWSAVRLGCKLYFNWSGMALHEKRIKSIDELQGRPADEFLREVARGNESITVVLSGGDSVILQPAHALKPLPELEGCVPEGWKDAAY
ncbi:MAG: hypothetical protein ACREDR_02980 [Blastocatellia bacterium]